MKTLALWSGIALGALMVTGAAAPARATVSNKEIAVCAPTDSTGFDFNRASNRWHASSFDIGGESHSIVRKNGRLIWTTVGGPSEVDLLCSEFDKNGFMTCGGTLFLVTINRKRDCYLASAVAGYWSNEADGADTPMMEIGVCKIAKL